LLRNVKVTSAFERSPLRRQDCDEIFSPLTGDTSIGGVAAGMVAGAAVSGTVGGALSVGIAASVGLALVSALGSGKAASCAATIKGKTIWGDWPMARIGPETSVHADSPVIAITGNNTAACVARWLRLSRLALSRQD
jgi:hypothetical protein